MLPLHGRQIYADEDSPIIGTIPGVTVMAVFAQKASDMLGTIDKLKTTIEGEQGELKGDIQLDTDIHRMDVSISLCFTDSTNCPHRRAWRTLSR